jgi:hypothetical protein
MVIGGWRMTSENLFQMYMAINNIASIQELSKKTKIEYTRLRKRIHDPQQLRLFELQSLNDALSFSDEDMLKLSKGDI